MVYLRVLARTGRAGCRRTCASSPPYSGYTAMPILCVVPWRSARGMIERLCIQRRWNLEVTIIFGTVARYFRATVGSSYDDAHPDYSALHTGAVRPHSGFVESIFFISPRAGHRSKVFECCQPFRFLFFCAYAIFVRKLMDSYCFNGPVDAEGRHSCPASQNPEEPHPLCNAMRQTTACLSRACLWLGSLLWGEY
jgi:hypothetical protein